jgi:hypothetical protein
MVSRAAFASENETMGYSDPMSQISLSIGSKDSLRLICDSNSTNYNAYMVGTSILMLNINRSIVIISYNN